MMPGSIHEPVRNCQGAALSNSQEMTQIALVARRYYLEGRSKVEIAREFGLSRFKVARLLERGRDEGIVRIEINEPAHVDLELSRAVEQAYPVKRALILASADGGAQGDYAALGRAAAELLGGMVTADDVLGISWGRTVNALVDKLPALPSCDVVQLVGGLPDSDLSVNAVDLIRRVRQRTGGQVYAMHAPLLVDDVDTAARLRRERHIAPAMTMLPRVTKAVVGIGAWHPPSSSLRQAMPSDERMLVNDRGACADICASVFDREGTAIYPQLESRAMAITSAQLMAVPHVIAVAGGAEKAAAVRAAALSGCIDTLVADTSAVQAMVTDVASH